MTNHCLSASDVGDECRVHGLIAFFFACYGAGSLAFDPFLKDRTHGPVAAADGPFVAALPQRLLSHPNGGALAVIGHVDRAWAYSFRAPDGRPRLLPYWNLLSRVLRGQPVGYATRDFADRFAVDSVRVSTAQDVSRPADPRTRADTIRAWIERNDAQYYVLLGDPAASLKFEVTP